MPDPQKELICQLARSIFDATNGLSAAENAEESLPSSVDLAKLTGISKDRVKKKLKVLMQLGLIRPVSMSPKRYKFERFAIYELPTDHDLYQDFCNPQSPFYLQIND
ncbi:MAG: helix-turn-helix domain-containing protein [Vampirovibrio sp.]|nr:helix-turn-helix domain-containing protein [Vampirovibrio sp.]